MKIEVLRCCNPAGRCRGLAISVDGLIIKGSCGGPYELLATADDNGLSLPPEVAAVVEAAKDIQSWDMCHWPKYVRLRRALAALDRKAT